MDRIDCLDHGYVRLVDAMGSDLSVVNAARVSFDRESGELNEADAKLIRYLAKHGHTSPFRHATLTFEVYAPLMVARQWWKYAVGSDHTMDSWNESSRRYVTEKPEFYIPTEWRKAPENRKQGSGDAVSAQYGDFFTGQLRLAVNDALYLYEEALAQGFAPEQARLFLPAYAMYVRWRWTASLQTVAHFLNQRLAEDAQYEIQEYARAVDQLALERFPVSMKALVS